MSGLPHCQVGEKQEWIDNRNYMIVEFATCVIIYVLKSNCDKALDKPKRCCCRIHQMVTLHILQYSYSLMTGSATVCCCIDCINCTAVDGWKKCTKAMTVATELVQKWCHWMLQWHSLLNNVACISAIDCCSTGATVALYAVQYSDRLLFYRCYSGKFWCAEQR
jgi:hypothetical protein